VPLALVDAGNTEQKTN